MLVPWSRPDISKITRRMRPAVIERPIDPDVADEAPNAAVLTGYGEEHGITYLRLSMQKPREPTGVRWRALCCISTRDVNPSVRAAPGRATWHAPNGWSSAAIATCFAAARHIDGSGARSRSLLYFFPNLVDAGADKEIQCERLSAASVTLSSEGRGHKFESCRARQIS
jgi:hypothetical protein